MYDFRIRIEFDVEVDNPSHIDAAFAAADWLQEKARENRFSYLVYEVASPRDLKDGSGTQFKTVDLEQIQYPEEESELEQR